MEKLRPCHIPKKSLEGKCPSRNVMLSPSICLITLNYLQKNRENCLFLTGGLLDLPKSILLV